MENQIKFPRFASFITSPAGRGLRILAGLALIVRGLQAQNKKGSAMALLGVVPLAAGALDVCLLGPLMGGKFKGSEMRLALHMQSGFPQLGSQSQSWIRS